MPATPRRCAAVPRPALWLLMCAVVLILVGCTSRVTGQIVPPTPTAGAVTLTLTEHTYTSHQPLGVMVNNTSKTAYYAETGLTVCTYLQLEFYDVARKAWLAVDGCTTVETPRVLLLAPTSTLPYTLAPGDSSTDPNAWVPGIYRIALRYSTKPDGSGTPVVVYSAGITVTN